MSIASVDLFNLLFVELLKISPSLINNYNSISDQIINLILLPHAILFLFLLGFGQVIAHEHKGLRYLIITVTYIFIVTQGWYGSFLIPLFQTWFWISLVIAIFLFFITRIIHPYTAKNLAGSAGKLAYTMGRNAGREKEIELLEEELKHVRNEMKQYKNSIDHNPGAAEVYNRLRGREFELKREIKKLDK
ncbi:MAG: hypothetical protein JW700_02320 [Candidatus Aenigmarchaeota archaeon]|nr:hypothetical protein [Candidatus Aenigmarchaeota archaeon]